ncbi:hypothetical protein J6590_044049 [Homalodisca vitripennis]|nr:hypothetical protein J6590_044049 [Homalodisca vitripennis]
MRIAPVPQLDWKVNLGTPMVTGIFRYKSVHKTIFLHLGTLAITAQSHSAVTLEGEGKCARVNVSFVAGRYRGAYAPVAPPVRTPVSVSICGISKRSEPVAIANKIEGVLNQGVDTATTLI